MTYWDGTRWVPDAHAPPPHRGRRVLGGIAEASLITALIFGLIAGSALAAKGGNKGGGGGKLSGTVSLVVLEGEDATPNHGERVGFVVSTTAERPFVGVRCWQGVNFVLDAYTGYFADYTGDPWVTLSSPYWHEGETASCSARLFYYDKRGNQKVLATTDFVTAP